MQKVWKLLNPETVFFATLFVMLFLGDGKQPVVDVVGIAVVLFLYFSRGLYHRRPASLSPTFNWAWILLLSYIFFTMLFSISVGFSISTFIRYLMAYLVFTYFYSVQTEEKRGFGKLLMLFGAAASLTSFVVMLVGHFGQSLPTMNLLYPAYGHNHIAEIVVFGLPLVVFYVRQKHDAKSLLLLTLYGVALVFSFARGALALIAGYLLFLLIIRKDITIKSKWLRSALIVACVGLAAFFVLVETKKIPVSGLIQRQVVKESITESRIPYWIQALRAFSDHPLFGSGPGTFYLLSKHYQDKPLSYSWFAHSYILETAAESGAVGVALVVFLLGVIFRFINHETSEQKALLDGVILMLVYSFFEFNLNFLVIWLLFWAALGILLKSHNEQKTTKNIVQNFAIILIGMYYVISLGSTIAETATHNVLPAAIIEPYNVDKVILATDQATEKKTLLPIWVRDSLLLFHRGNPEALMSLAKYTDSRRAPDLVVYQKAVDTDPQNADYLGQYVSVLLDNNKKTQIGRLLKDKGQQVLVQSNWNSLRNIDWTSSTITLLLTKSLFADVGQQTTISEYLSKAYYFLGYLLLNSKPTQTLALWTIARDSAPEWGYFHIELASLEYHVVGDKRGAEKVLKDCRVFTYAARQCEEATIRDIMPGSQYESVQAIPSLH